MKFRTTIIISVEIFLLLTGIVLGFLWINNPTGNFEPYLAVIGLILTCFEMLRRKNKIKNENRSCEKITLNQNLKNSTTPYKASSTYNFSAEKIPLEISPQEIAEKKEHFSELEFHDYFESLVLLINRCIENILLS